MGFNLLWLQIKLPCLLQAESTEQHFCCIAHYEDETVIFTTGNGFEMCEMNLFACRNTNANIYQNTPEILTLNG